MKFLKLQKVMVLVLVVGLTAGIAQVASAQIITSIQRRNSSNTWPQIAGPLAEDALAFVDRNHEYNVIPMVLVGAEYIKVANNDKATPNYELDVTLSQDAALFLLLDNRLGHGQMTYEDGYLLDPDLLAAGMSWIINLGFVDTGLDIGVDEGGNGTIDRWSSVYAKEVSPGTTTLLQQYDTTDPYVTYRNMYGVAAVPGALNLPPVVDAGNDQIIVWPDNSVQLDATVSDDDKPVPPGKVTLTWTVQSSPNGSTVQFDPNEFVDDPVARFDKSGLYILRLTAYDGSLSESNTVTITVKEPSCPVGDLNKDCRVDWQDVQILAGQWLTDPVCWGFGCPDLDADDIVNLGDFAWLGENWDERGPVLESTALRIILIRNPYSFMIIEKSSGQTLLSQKETTFMLDGSSCIAVSAYNVTVTTTTMDADLVLAGTSGRGHVKFSFQSPELAQVLLTCSKPPPPPPAATSFVPEMARVLLTYDGGAPSNVKEEFIDQGEHYYGVWEYPQGRNIDNRGADADMLGFGNKPNTNWCGGRAPFYVTSGKYGIYVDTVAKGHYTIAVSGKTSFDFDSEQMAYYFIYGPSYENILSRFNDLAGPSVMPPDWAFDSIWWRDDDHQDFGHLDIVENRIIDSAQKNVEATANHLRYYQIYASTIWIDRPYTSGGWGWGNTEFNPNSDWFPDAQGMINYLNSKGYNLLLWIANRCYGELGNEALLYGYIFPGYEGHGSPAADMRMPQAYNWFKGKLDTFVSMGVRGYKVDRGAEGEMPDWVQNENVYLFHKMASEGQVDRHGNDHLIFARNAFDKSRKYIGIWNGDTDDSFGGLAVSIKNGLRCGAINFPLYGSDTGGYFGVPTYELFARWLQFSTYCTMMEILIDPDRTIWYSNDYDPSLIDIARKQCSDHHDLIPYTKSCMYTAHQTGMPVMRQLIFAYPDDSNLYDMWDEYLYGSEILVAPVTTAGANSRSVYLPAGKWLDYNNKSTVYTGPATITASAPLDTIALFVRAGAIIPRGDILQSNNNWTGGWAPYLRIEFFPYDNTGNTFNYYTGSQVRPISCSMSGDGVVDIQFDNLGYNGSLEVYCRGYTTVTRNGAALSEGIDFTYDLGRMLLTIPFTGTTTVEITGVTSIF